MVVVCLFACAGLAAPPLAQAQGPSKPLRHLEYTFAVDYEGVSEQHLNNFNGISNGNSGILGSSSSEGGRGTMSVDVLSIDPDGALTVRISEWVQNEAHPGQAYTCLLAYLGRQFVDAAPWDAQHHWQRRTDTTEYSVIEDFAMDPSSDDKRAVIRETKKMDLHNGGFSTQSEDVQITYDRSMEVPISVRDNVQRAGTGGSGHTEFSFNLTADSFAAAAPTSH
jgi:hypothetical protein